MNPMKQLEQTVEAVSQAIPPELLTQLKATNPKIVSTRSVRFDIPDGKDGINRIKVTLENGKFLVRFYRVQEVEILYDMPAANVADGIKTILGLKAAH